HRNDIYLVNAHRRFDNGQADMSNLAAGLCRDGVGASSVERGCNSVRLCAGNDERSGRVSRYGVVGAKSGKNDRFEDADRRAIIKRVAVSRMVNGFRFYLD